MEGEKIQEGTTNREAQLAVRVWGDGDAAPLLERLKGWKVLESGSLHRSEKLEESQVCKDAKAEISSLIFSLR